MKIYQQIREICNAWRVPVTPICLTRKLNPYRWRGVGQEAAQRPQMSKPSWVAASDFDRHRWHCSEPERRALMRNPSYPVRFLPLTIPLAKC